MYDLIVINCAGHGNLTAGKRSPDGSLREFWFNKPTAKYLEDELKGYERVLVVNVHDTVGNVDVLLPDRTKVANDMKRKYPKAKVIYVSIHANAFGDGESFNSASGIETFIHPNHSRESFQLAKLVQDNLIKATKRSDRGVKQANYAVLRQTDRAARKENLLDAAILVECEFMTNREANELLKSDAYRKTCAKAILDAIVFMFALKKKGGVTVSQHEPSSWAKASVEKAIKAGLTDGTNPKEPLTFERFLVIIDRLGLIKEGK